MNTRQKLDPDCAYKWAATIAHGAVRQDHWGVYPPQSPGPAITVGTAMDEVRKLCAKKAGWPVSKTRLVAFEGVSC